MQETNPLPWGALDRFQAHFIVRKDVGDHTEKFVAKTILSTKGHFGGKEVTGVTWNGGEIANTLNADSTLNELICKQSVHDATIYIEPTETGVRIRPKWKNHLDFGITKELFEIYDKIAGHIKSL